jgi:hypothetical protein
MAAQGGAVGAADFPTDPDKADKLCEAIGESGNPDISPEERVWFGETCTCRAPVGCGVPGSPRWQGRAEAERRKQEEREAVVRKEQEEANAARSKRAKASCAQLVECVRTHPGNPGACEAAEGEFEYECSATVRDVAGCGLVIKAMRENPGKASCGGPFE